MTKKQAVILVVAAHLYEYREWCRLHGLEWTNTEVVRWVRQVDELRGWSDQNSALVVLSHTGDDPDGAYLAAHAERWKVVEQ